MKPSLKCLLLFFLSLIGIAISFYLTWQHFYADEASCSIAGSNCHSVLNSRYAVIGPFYLKFGDQFLLLGPFSLAALSLVFFIYLFFPITYAMLRPSQAQTILSFPFLVVIFSSLVPLYLLFVSLFDLGAFCVYCVSLYLVIWALFAVFLSLFKLPLWRAPLFIFHYFKTLTRNTSMFSFPLRFGRHILYALFFGTVALGSISILEARRLPEKQSNPFQKQGQSPESRPSDSTRRNSIESSRCFESIQIDRENPILDFKQCEPVFGKKNARLTLVEFSDFGCPHCKKAAEFIEPILKKYEKDLAFYFVQFPLDQNCNSLLKRQMHEGACEAAKVAICAEAEGRFFDAHDLLFENGGFDFSKSAFLKIAAELGFERGQFEACIESEKTKKRLEKDILLGQKIKLQKTPTFYLNGKLVDLNEFESMIEKELETSSLDLNQSQ